MPFSANISARLADLVANSDEARVQQAPEHAHLRTMAFFAHDSTESTVIKRATTFQSLGWNIAGFMFRRVRPAEPRPLTWENVELGTTVDLHYAQRLAKLLSACVKIVTHRARLRRCAVFYARNIDMLLLAMFAKYVARRDATVVYEVLDVPRAVLGDGVLNRTLRWIERRLLARIDCLVVSSPEFMTQYFSKYQGYGGRWRLLENKISASQLPADTAPGEGSIPPGPPWVIGWFGTLRCQRSVQQLSYIAERMGDRVQIHIRGLASEEYLPSHMIRAAAERHANIVYFGPYASPLDLPSIYGQVHFTWSIDYLDAGTNSDWLLPNRVYEGGLMGSVALARAHTATGRMVEREQLGLALEEPLADAVVALLNSMDGEAYTQMREIIAGKPRSLFVDEADTRDLLNDLEALARKRQTARQPQLRR